MSETHAEAVRKQVKGYLVVFAALAGLTFATVAASYLPVSTVVHVLIALAIAAVKAGLVAAYFMHLISERSAIFAILVLTAAFFAALIVLPLGSGADAVTLE